VAGGLLQPAIYLDGPFCFAGSFDLQSLHCLRSCNISLVASISPGSCETAMHFSRSLMASAFSPCWV
jgi:hypothetical protein